MKKSQYSKLLGELADKAREITKELDTIDNNVGLNDFGRATLREAMTKRLKPSYDELHNRVMDVTNNLWNDVEKRWTKTVVDNIDNLEYQAGIKSAVKLFESDKVNMSIGKAIIDKYKHDRLALTLFENALGGRFNYDSPTEKIELANYIPEDDARTKDLLEKLANSVSELTFERNILYRGYNEARCDDIIQRFLLDYLDEDFLAIR